MAPAESAAASPSHAFSAGGDASTRQALLAPLEDMIRDAVAEGRPTALILFDINGFAEINAGWGVATGDAILTTVADRLREGANVHLAKHAAALVSGRLDADHFAVAASGVDSWGAVRDAAAEVLRTIIRPCRVGGKTLVLSARAAIVRVPEHAGSVSSALGRGFRLLNGAARVRPDAVALSEPEDTQSKSGAGLERDLAAALKTDQIFLVFQPKVVTATEALHGAEALVRWRHPTMGLLPPMTFIGTAEKSGLIFDLGLRVLRDACRAAEAFGSERRGLSIAVNISPTQLAHPDFLSRFLEVLDEEGAAPSTISVEITETAAMMGGEIITNNLRSLRRCGLEVAIDDFGTGFSNLASLSTLQADTLKIDRSLVAHDDEDRKSAALLGLTVQLAHTFSMKTVAEGVETTVQLERAREIGCDYVQGYLTGKPLERADFKELYLSRPRTGE